MSNQESTDAVEVTLVQRIKDDIRTARFAKDSGKIALLSTLLGEAERKGKDDGNRAPTDNEVIEVAGKFVSNLRELKAARPSDTAIDYEINILRNYLPKPLTHHEMEINVEKIILSLKASSLKDMKTVMGAFREQFAGRFDGNALAKTVKEQLTVLAEA